MSLWTACCQWSSTKSGRFPLGISLIGWNVLGPITAPRADVGERFLRRDRWARLRFAIMGPPLATPPAAGELHEALAVWAAKTWRHPFTGLDVRFEVPTIERWLYAAKRAADPVRALRNQVRRDIRVTAPACA